MLAPHPIAVIAVVFLEYVFDSVAAQFCRKKPCIYRNELEFIRVARIEPQSPEVL
jgi:hypothetical protein